MNITHNLIKMVFINIECGILKFSLNEFKVYLSVLNACKIWIKIMRKGQKDIFKIIRGA